MTDKKLTDNEIKKALECCARGYDCRECPMNAPNCYARVPMAFALDLINRLQAENERLKGYVSPVVKLLNAYDIEQTKAEAYKEFAELVQGEIVDAIHSNYNAKEERVAKSKKLGIPIDAEDSFLMYCDGKIHALSGINSHIDNLLKEMVGDADGRAT